MEDNSLNLKKCYDNLYMEKINCSFPWLKSYDGPLKRCGSNDYMRDLVSAIKMFHLNRTYCNVPNCVNTKWTKATERQILTHDGKSNFSTLFLNFPSSTKVSILNSIFFSN